MPEPQGAAIGFESGIVNSFYLKRLRSTLENVIDDIFMNGDMADTHYATRSHS